MKYRLSIPAERDLAGIAQSTAERWGNVQCLRYGLLLENALQQLARLPSMGKPRDDIAPDIRSFAVGSHVIFYRHTSQGIDIARILHQRMDLTQIN